MRVVQTIDTNKPFTVSTCPSMIFEIPDGETVQLLCSVRGNEYEDLNGIMYGPQLVSVAHIPSGVYFKIICDNDIKINILR